MEALVALTVLLFSIPAICSPVPIGTTLKVLEKITGCRMIITSGYRSRAKNKSVGGAKNSYHLYNRARDIVPKRKKCISFKELGKIACEYTSTIVYFDHVHIDNRKKKICIQGAHK